MGRSPWAWRPPAPVAVVSPPTGGLDAAVAIPGSKSFTNRALLIAALADGPTELHGVLRSDDSYWAVEALRRLGVVVEEVGDRFLIHGTGGRWPRREGTLYVGSAGTLARFLPGVLAAAPRGHGQWRIDGSPQLRARPVAPLVRALADLGANIVSGSEGQDVSLPFVIHAGLTGGVVHIPGHVSSQYTSGVLLAAPYADKSTVVHVQGPLVQPDYVRITAALMTSFGVPVQEQVVDHDGGLRFVVEPDRYRRGQYTLEADASTAGYFWAWAMLTRGRIRVTNVGYDSLQPDARFVDVLARMGARVTKGAGWMEVQGPARIRGGFTADMRPMSDQALTLGALAVFADGPVAVTGIAHIRQHESDRIHVFCKEMAKLGIRTEERDDGFVVYPGTPIPRDPIDPHDDHRHAMAFALLGAKVPGIAIADPGCVSKTYPAYFEMLARLGVPVSYR